ncbi:MAG: lipid-A-disaccharide synthase [Pyrinomonadaceae bacterium]|nr:lipid-A-disaccharide synthase [Pyrinomonadaceae bacterium]MCX7639213.1 lipid-A-disaccharide synthase [Pyrinomonadaceae bacterium]MDW8303565.1 lipid-A-disaccharide synthase [Acidobacteriota bacterium]
MKRLMIVVGEASGDALAARLVRRLRELSEEKIEFFGATGKNLRACGVETIVDADELSVVGVLEIALSLPMFLRAFKRLKQEALLRKPDALILVDFPDFNLKLAKALKKRGLKVIYYISPQIWAWRGYRIKAIRKFVDLLLVILPFEKQWYFERGIHHVEYVGNPLVGEVFASCSKEQFCSKHGLDPNKPIIAFLAGSRQKELSRILPVMIETAEIMHRRNREIQFVNALAPTRRIEEVQKAKNSVLRKLNNLNASLITVYGETYDALNASDVAAVTSGTATLEAAIIGTPLVVVYKTSSLNYKLLRPLIDVPHFSLVNLIAGKRLVTELIQDEFTPEKLSEELFFLLEKPNNEKMRMELKNIVATLGQGGAALNAARAILNFLEK